MKDVIIACDFGSAAKALEFLDKFADCPRKPFVKIGMELFYGAGPDIVRAIKARGHKIFLDLKLHDIPNTVRKTMQVLSALDVDMTNVHAAGTIEMMKAAREGLTREDGTRPLLIAVTQLTSTSEERMHSDLLIGAPINDTIAHYAACAREAGLDGVVCSPLEASLIKERCGKEFLTVTPGIRFADADVAEGEYYEPEVCYQVTSKLLDLADRPTCILFPDDFSLSGGVRAILDRGLRIPKDISVIGYDGILMSQLMSPKITTLHQDTETLGKEAAKKLIALIEHPKTALLDRILVPGELMPGESVSQLV